MRFASLVSLLCIVLFPSQAQSGGYDLVHEIQIDNEITDVAWNGDGTLLAVSDVVGVTIFDSRYLEVEAFEYSYPVHSVDWNRTDNRLAVAVGADNGWVDIWDMTESTVALEHTIPFSATPKKVRWSPDGLKLAVFYSIFQDLSIYFLDVWDAQTWQKISTGSDVYARASEIDWTSDSSRIFGSGESYCLNEVCNPPRFKFGGIFGVEASTGNTIAGRAIGAVSANSLDVGANDTIAVAEATVELYESTSLNWTQDYVDPAGGIALIRWLPNDPRLVYATYELAVLDSETGSTHKFGTSQLTLALAVHPDGSKVARAAALTGDIYLVDIWSIPPRAVDPGTPTVTPRPTLSVGATPTPTATANPRP